MQSTAKQTRTKPRTVRDLRVQIVTHSLFAPTTLARAIRRLGFVQADPISAPARAQDLILRHRVRNYHLGDLERRYPDLALEEDLLHVYGFFPRSVLSLVHPRDGQWGVEREYPKLARRVLSFVRRKGEADHHQVEKSLGRMHTRGEWAGRAWATTRILDMLHYRGQLRVSSRQGNLRRYVPTTPPKTNLHPAERLRRLVLLLARLYAPLTETALRSLASSMRYAAPSLDGRRTVVGELLKSGQLERAVVDGISYVWPVGEWLTEDAPREVRFLAPFDPIVWDRRRFQHLWGWPYLFEAYTPSAKRRWGYYALPMLWAERVIGWANVTSGADRAEVRVGFIGRRPAGKDFSKALEAERGRLQEFLRPAGVSRLDLA